MNTETQEQKAELARWLQNEIEQAKRNIISSNYDGDRKIYQGRFVALCEVMRKLDS